MKILGICGSPRIGGNTDFLLDRLLTTASNYGVGVEKIMLNTLKFSPCQECRNAPKDGTCIVNDDMQGVYDKIDSAEVIILATPVFFGSVSAQTKMMIDRFQCVWTAKYLYKTLKADRTKTGVFICIEATKKQSFLDNAKSIAKNFFVTVGAEYKDEILCQGVEAKGSILQHGECLDKAYKLGAELASGK